MSHAVFVYRVQDARGHVIAGQIEAATAAAAQQQLRSDGFTVLELEEEDGLGSLFPRRVTRQDIIYFTSQLAVMVDTGITLSAALDGVLQQEANSTLKDVLTDLKSTVEAGDDFSAALAKHPKLFDRTYVSLIKASEATGSLGEMLERIAAYLRKEVETRSKIRAALAYPTVMLVMAVAVTVFLLTFIMPKFMPLFERQGVELPTPTKFMLALSGAVTHYWYLWTVLGVAAVVGFVASRRTPRGRQGWDWLKINAPILGPMFRKVALSRSVRTLGTMISSGVSVLEALDLTAEVSGNHYYRQLWLSVRTRVTTGLQINECVSGEPLVPRVLVQMIKAGEDSGRLDQVLLKISNYYDHDVDQAVKAVTSLIEPLMIVVMGFVVGGIAMALLLPIFSLSRRPG